MDGSTLEIGGRYFMRIKQKQVIVRLLRVEDVPRQDVPRVSGVQVRRRVRYTFQRSDNGEIIYKFKAGALSCHTDACALLFEKCNCSKLLQRGE